LFPPKKKGDLHAEIAPGFYETTSCPSKTRVVRLERRGKTLCGVCGRASRRIYDRKLRRVRDLSAGDARIYLEVETRRVRCRSCAKLKQEKLPWLSDNPFYTKRFAFYVGRRCRTSTIQVHLILPSIRAFDSKVAIRD
jgi:transposase